MNTKLNPGSMVSTKGFSIHRVGRHELQYNAGDSILTIEVEEGSDLAVYLSRVQHWDAPRETQAIGEQELALLRDHTREGLKFLGIKCVFA